MPVPTFVGFCFGLAWLAPLAAGQDAGPAARQSVDYNEQVRPILARHCFKCHGPDDKARKAKLRLDKEDSAKQPASSGETPIVPGKPDDSELVRRIFAPEPDGSMPPPAANAPLSAAQREILKRWVLEGGRYDLHWAFRQPVKPASPKVRDAHWVRNAIDAFILARLDREGLKPSGEADRATLLRRATLDLTGLPPTPEEVDAFIADQLQGAYERQVDRLLASPRYGERWARRWLDMARYADTNGYEKDRPRSIWPYRDWVINALNSDLSFDRFTIEQLAGDMLPGAGVLERVATGFHRNTMLNEEGGIDPLEFRFYAMTDRVATTGTTWLGLTIGCAQCHTHKFDPITHRDYYQFMALLNNADEPKMRVPSASNADRRSSIERRVAAMKADLLNQFPLAEDGENKSRTVAGDKVAVARRRREHLDRQFRQWREAATAQTARWAMLEPTKASANVPRLTIEAEGTVFASGDMSKRDVYTVQLKSTQKRITAIRLEALPDDRLPSRGPGRVYYEGPFGDFFLSEIHLSANGKNASFQEATASNPKASKDAAAAIDGDPETGWSINGGQGHEQSAVFRLATPLEGPGEITIEMVFERYYAAGLGRFRISATDDPRAVSAREIPFALEPILLIPEDARKPDQVERLRDYYVSVAPELAKAREAIAKLESEIPAAPSTLVMAERPPDNPRPTFVHNRGEFLQPTERVEPAVLSMLPAMAPGLPRNRLGLARWLVSGSNPLTGRVVMNYQWAAFFGKGIVRTVEDFGYQGERPSHPELLDYLAVSLVQEGWSLKRMHRAIVTSATYRQSSRVTPEALAKDPENRFLARGPRVRLEAEMIRDSVVKASGLLFERIGGESVFPPQPPGVSTEGAYGGLAWNPSPGGDRYRRGLYTFTKRTAPYAMTLTFDGPSGEVCVARREMSNSPLQALTLLNDPVFVEACQALGRSTHSTQGTAQDRVRRLFRMCLARSPQPDELSMLVHFYQNQRERLEHKKLDAAKLAGQATPEAIDCAAWTVLARAILNLDETVTKG
jgi:mono/diheme cytochrome c family protein